MEIGGAVGGAVAGAVWSANLLPKLQTYLPEASKGDAALIFGNLTIAKGFAEGSAERAVVVRGYQETMDLLLVVAVCLCVPLLPLSLGLRDYRLDRVDQRVRGRVIGRVAEVEGGDGGGEVEEEGRGAEEEGGDRDVGEARGWREWWRRRVDN